MGVTKLCKAIVDNKTKPSGSTEGTVGKKNGIHYRKKKGYKRMDMVILNVNSVDTK